MSAVIRISLSRDVQGRADRIYRSGQHSRRAKIDWSRRTDHGATAQINACRDYTVGARTPLAVLARRVVHIYTVSRPRRRQFLRHLSSCLSVSYFGLTICPFVPVDCLPAFSLNLLLQSTSPAEIPPSRSTLFGHMPHPCLRRLPCYLRSMHSSIQCSEPRPLITITTRCSSRTAPAHQSDISRPPAACILFLISPQDHGSQLTIIRLPQRRQTPFSAAAMLRITLPPPPPYQLTRLPCPRPCPPLYSCPVVVDDAVVFAHRYA